jgi:hypothetical protein
MAFAGCWLQGCYGGVDASVWDICPTWALRCCMESNFPDAEVDHGDVLEVAERRVAWRNYLEVARQG